MLIPTLFEKVTVRLFPLMFSPFTVSVVFVIFITSFRLSSSVMVGYIHQTALCEPFRLLNRIDC